MSEAIRTTETGPALYLAKIPLRVPELIRIALKRGIAVRDIDEGYLAHTLLTELWQSRAPRPFVLKGARLQADANAQGVVDVWGYTRLPDEALREHAAEFGDPEIVTAIFGGLESIKSRPMPTFEPGRRVGFLLRACPVVRTRHEGQGQRPLDKKGRPKAREVDAWLAHRFKQWTEDPPESGSTVSDREAVYAGWLKTRLDGRGATIERVGLGGFQRERLVRRTQGEQRRAKTLERPDVQFEGDLVVTDRDKFQSLLAEGVGRHRTFGFGMLLIVPPSGS